MVRRGRADQAGHGNSAPDQRRRRRTVKLIQGVIFDITEERAEEEIVFPRQPPQATGVFRTVARSFEEMLERRRSPRDGFDRASACCSSISTTSSS